jgi:hypothetical protein
MMEFWHCHKPDHHHHGHDEETGKAGEESLAARGYGASSTISAQPGVGFVDLTTLLFDETDCQNVTVSLMLAGVFTWLLVSYSTLLEEVFVLGIKKVANPAYTASMAWIPIQMPQINIMARFPVYSGYWLVLNLPRDGSLPLVESQPPPFTRTFTSQECSGINGGTCIHALLPVSKWLTVLFLVLVVYL